MAYSLKLIHTKLWVHTMGPGAFSKLQYQDTQYPDFGLGQNLRLRIFQAGLHIRVLIAGPIIFYDIGQAIAEIRPIRSFKAGVHAWKW